MAKVIEVTVSRALTINLGNYESHRIEISKTVLLDDGDSVSEVQDKLLTKILKDLRIEEKAVRKANTSK